jgi:hypothetical protein
MYAADPTTEDCETDRETVGRFTVASRSAFIAVSCRVMVAHKTTRRSRPSRRSRKRRGNALNVNVLPSDAAFRDLALRDLPIHTPAYVHRAAKLLMAAKASGLSEKEFRRIRARILRAAERFCIKVDMPARRT